MDTSLFSETFSDAIDVDFGKGKVTNSSFMALGNDAVDVSGSVVDVQGMSVNGAGD